VRDVLVEEPFELDAVPDEGAVAELAAHRSHPAFRVCVRDRCARRGADDCRPGASEDSSKPATNWPPPSRIRNRSECW
jgi:hypothetical protein